MSRLQGPEWHLFKNNHKLTILCISKSDAGNYRVDVKNEYGKHFYHWLNSQEAAKLENSGWLENHKVYSTTELYEDNNKLIKKVYSGDIVS